MAQPEVGTIKVELDGESLAKAVAGLEDTKKALKSVEFQARKTVKELARLLELANRLGAMGVGFEVVSNKEA